MRPGGGSRIRPAGKPGIFMRICRATYPSPAQIIIRKLGEMLQMMGEMYSEKYYLIMDVNFIIYISVLLSVRCLGIFSQNLALENEE